MNHEKHQNHETKEEGLVPRLRFPEFRDSGEWGEKPISNIGQVITGSTPSTTDRSYYGGDIMFVSPADISDQYFVAETAKSLTKKGLSKARIIPAGSILFVCIGSTIGKIAQNKFDCATNQQINAISPFDQYVKEFIYYALALKSEKISELAGNQAVPIINKSLFSTALINVPSDKDEQQKIADCLSSLDALITAQVDKIDALKTHKKGLMQQLFPREGETTPRLRFPEFLDAEEWEKINLGSVGKVSMCKRVLKSETKPEGDIPFYKIGTFGKQADAYIDKKIFEYYKDRYSYPKKGEILISAAGTIGRLVVFDGNNAYFQDSNIVWIANDEDSVTNAFLFYCYQRVVWTTDDNTIARLYNDNLRAIEIPICSIPEQQKIADCLTSLEHLITTQTEKLDALKAHKKGLMQQLFPSPDAVGL